MILLNDSVISLVSNAMSFCVATFGIPNSLESSTRERRA
jgi:hypothetical protein